MVEEQTEMSLDEMLSSIKQMVIDKDPPVLELTDMVSSDGTIVKVKNGQKKSKSKSELRDFLRLAQENGKESQPSSDLSPSKLRTKVCNENSDANVSESESDLVLSESSEGLPKHADCKNPMASGSGVTVDEIIREVSAPLIKDWLEKNLPSLAKEIITAEIQKMIKRN